MPKKLVNLTDRQVDKLTREAERLQVSFTELVRRIIDAHIAKVLIVAVLAAGCGQSPTAPVQPAALEARGELTLACGDETCAFEGRAVNMGSGCATHISGTVGLMVVGQSEPRFAQAWALPSDRVVSPGEFAYTGSVPKKLIVAMLPTQWYTRTTFSWTDTPCR